MPIVTDEELKILESTPEGAAVAKKLREAGDYIPKSRFDEVNERAKASADALAKYDAEKKAAEDDKARKAGEFEKIESTHKARIAELEKIAADEKKVADEYRTAKQARIDTMKKEFGDAWLPEYESFSIASLDKIQAQRKPGQPSGKPDAGRPGAPVGGKDWAQMTNAERESMIEAAKRGELKTP
jgi:hypothetical protein